MTNKLKQPYCSTELCISTRLELGGKTVDELYKILNKCNKCSVENKDNDIVQETRNTIWSKWAKEFTNNINILKNFN